MLIHQNEKSDPDPNIIALIPHSAFLTPYTSSVFFSGDVSSRKFRHVAIVSQRGATPKITPSDLHYARSAGG